MASSSAPLTYQHFHDDLPAAITDYLLTLTTNNRPFAYVQVTIEGYITSYGGDLNTYGLENTKIGDLISEPLFYLDGFFPHQGKNEVLPSIQTDQGNTVDIHLVREQTHQSHENGHNQHPHHNDQNPDMHVDPDQLWVLLIDSSLATQKQQQIQQTANELSLLQQAYDRLATHNQTTLTQTTSNQTKPNQTKSNQTKPIALKHQSSLGKTATTTTQCISILIIKIGSGSQPTRAYAKLEKPDLLKPDLLARMRLLNDCFSSINQTIVNAGGFIHHIFGQSAIALFESSPQSTATPSPPDQSQPDPSQHHSQETSQALQAAIQLLQPQKNWQQQDTELVNAPTNQLAVGLGLTIGQAAITRHPESRLPMSNVLGPVISTALTLSQQVQSNCLAIDGHTLSRITIDPQDFQLKTTNNNQNTGQSLHNDHFHSQTLDPSKIYQFFPK